MANIFERAKTAFDLLFRPDKLGQVNQYFQMLDGYTPSFYTYDGGVYEMELTRSCIHAFANHTSKLQPKVNGADLRGIQSLLDTKPNFFMTGAQFLYKCATIYDTQNTLWIVPILSKTESIVGYYPLNPQHVEVITVEGEPEPYLRYTFADGSHGAMELRRCGVVSKYLYKSDLVGETNECLRPTLQLNSLQDQGIAEGIKNGASFRFMANASNWSKGKDLAAERDNFMENNFNKGSGGLILFPNTYTNIQQIKSNPELVDPEQMRIIQTRVYNYFGCNEGILQNKCTGDEWAAYYEGKIEPFALQLSQAMSAMTYSSTETARNNAIVWASNRVQYMTTADKLSMASQMFDRGILSTNDVMDIWQLPHVADGDRRYIRKEYIDTTQIGAQPIEDPANPEPKED